MSVITRKTRTNILGALTLKSFPFELRDWDVDSSEGYDPTDSSGANTRVFVKEGVVVLVEPSYTPYTSRSWITDKGRQFFDGIFGDWAENLKNKTKHTKRPWWYADPKVRVWNTLFADIITALYFFDYHGGRVSKKITVGKFFTIVFENVGLELLSYFSLLKNAYSFLKLKKAEPNKTENDLEANYQTNLSHNHSRLSQSTFFFLVSTNLRYEGYSLNLGLKKREASGNFRCVTLGAAVAATFTTFFLGANTKILNSLGSGNNGVCQELRGSKNPVFIFNSEFFKRSGAGSFAALLNTFKFSGLLTKSWFGLCVLNYSLSENGANTVNAFSSLTVFDLTGHSLLYFLNVETNNLSHLKALTRLTLYNFSKKSLTTKTLVLTQKYKETCEAALFLKSALELRSRHLPCGLFYAAEETYVTTCGEILNTAKIIPQKKTKNQWQIVRRLFSLIKGKLLFNKTPRDNSRATLDFKDISVFRNFISFSALASNNIVNLNFYIINETRAFTYFSKHKYFKTKTFKTLNFKIAHWLNDFFSGGRDEYSIYSNILGACSAGLKTNSGTFF